MLGALITCPLEVVKTRLQVRHWSCNVFNRIVRGTDSAGAVQARGNKASLEQRFRFGLGTYSALRSVICAESIERTIDSLAAPSLAHSLTRPLYRPLSRRTLLVEEGFAGLYRGLGPNLVGVIPARSIYFFSYGTTKEWLTRSFELTGTTVSFLAGVVAGVAVVTTTQPIWLVKTRMQLQSSKDDNVRSVVSSVLVLLRFQSPQSDFPLPLRSECIRIRLMQFRKYTRRRACAHFIGA